MSEFQVRLLEGAEAQGLFEFRQQIFFGELGARLSREEIERGYMVDSLDEIGWNYGAFLEGKLVGSLRLVDLARVPDPAPLIEKYRLAPMIERFGLPSMCQIGRLALASEVRSGAALVSLICRAYLDGRRHGFRLAVSDCSPYLLPHYETLGYRCYGEAFNDRAYGLKVPILLLAGDLTHLRALRSPFARITEGQPSDEDAAAWFRATYPAYSTEGGQPYSVRRLEVLAETVGFEPLARRSLFLGLNPEEVRTLLTQSTTMKLRAGDYLIRRGLREANLYFLLGGMVEVLDEEGRGLLKLGEGEFLGEMAALLDSPRTADVVAREASECLLINSRTLERLLENQPRLYGKVMRNVARSLALRLRALAS
jgi:hypothetical protein